MLPTDAKTVYLNGTGTIFTAHEGYTILGAGINIIDGYADCVDPFYISNEAGDHVYVASPYIADVSIASAPLSSYSGPIVETFNSDSDIDLILSGPSSGACSSIPVGWVTYIERPYASSTLEVSAQGYNGPNINEWTFGLGVLLFFLSLMAWRYIFRPVKEMGDD